MGQENRKKSFCFTLNLFFQRNETLVQFLSKKSERFTLSVLSASMLTSLFRVYAAATKIMTLKENNILICLQALCEFVDASWIHPSCVCYAWTHCKEMKVRYTIWPRPRKSTKLRSNKTRLDWNSMHSPKCPLCTRSSIDFCCIGAIRVVSRSICCGELEFIVFVSTYPSHQVHLLNLNCWKLVTKDRTIPRQIHELCG